MAGVFSKMLKKIKLDYDDYDDEDELTYEDEEEIEEELPKNKKTEKNNFASSEPKKVEPEKKGTFRSKTSSNVVPLKGGDEDNNMEVCMLCPKSEADKKEIADVLLSGKSVVLNMEGLDMVFAQNIIDFTSGTCYAIDGDVKQIAKYIFIATPENVELIGEFMDIVSDKFDGRLDASRFNNKF